MAAPRFSLWLAVCASALGWALPVAAEERASLEVVRGPGAESCPDAEALASQVGALERRAALVAGPSTSEALHFSVSMERAPEHFRARIVVSGARSGERTLTDSGQTCAGLADAVALTLAMLTEPAEPEAPPAPPPAASAPPPPAPPSLAPVADAEPAPRTPQLADLSLAVRAGPALTVGLLDRAGVAATASVEIGTRSFHAGLGVLWAPEQTVEHGPGSVDVSLVALTLTACLDLAGDDRGVELAACAAQAAGSVRGTGRGYDAYTRSAGRPWLAIGGGARVGGPLVGPLGWSAGVLALAPLSDEKFAVEGVSGTAHEPAPVAVVGGASLQISIW